MSIMLHITYNYALQTLCGAPHNVCNDNGIAENLPLNRMLGDYDIIHGTFFVCGLTRDDFTDLTPAADEALRGTVPRPAAVFPAGQDPVCGTHHAGRILPCYDPAAEHKRKPRKIRRKYL